MHTSFFVNLHHLRLCDGSNISRIHFKSIHTNTKKQQRTRIHNKKLSASNRSHLLPTSCHVCTQTIFLSSHKWEPAPCSPHSNTRKWETSSSSSSFSKHLKCTENKTIKNQKKAEKQILMCNTKVEVCCNGVFGISAKHCYKICDFTHEVHIDEKKKKKMFLP